MANSVQGKDVLKSITSIVRATAVAAPILVVAGAACRVLWEVTKAGWTFFGYIP